MILADTSVWIQHLRRRSDEFAACLVRGEICIHPVVIGELATGNLPRRERLLDLLRKLPRISEVDFEGCLDFIEKHRLFGSGVGWSDAQLLAAAQSSAVSLWSLDKRLAAAARRLRISRS